jgi:hypothetical protein
MSSFIPHETLFAYSAEYEGIHLDVFFFARTVVGLPAKAPTLNEDDENIGFSLLELTTI